MKRTIFAPGILLAIAVALFSCSSGQNGAAQKAKELQAGISAMKPGGIATTAGGYTMTAKINGRDWAATSIISPAIAGVIAGENNDESIALPYYNKRSLLGLKKRKLGEGHGGVDMRLNDDVKFWSAKTGEMEITKVDDNWIEGKFSFIAVNTASGKTVAVTDGFFRIAFAQKN